MFDCRRERRFGFREHWVEWEVWIQQGRTYKREENVQGRKFQVGQWVLDSKEQNKQDRLGGFQRIVDGSV